MDIVVPQPGTESNQGGAQGDVRPAELAAMRLALRLAASPEAPYGPNPRVGCVLLDEGGQPIAHGFHRGAGTDHAEVAALKCAADSGVSVFGATAVVTLEPCNHRGRTGPCARALMEAGIGRVIFGQADPNPIAAGGAQTLRAAGIPVCGGVCKDLAEDLNREWTFAMGHGRPFVTWKVAATLDGRVAATDGTSKWITSAAARADVHQLRRQVQAVIVGTGTALADDPNLTVRDPTGRLLPQQPLRVVIGRRALPPSARLRDGAAQLLHYQTTEVAGVLADLAVHEVRHALLEGGPTLAAAFFAAGLVDAVRWYVAPAVLGAGQGAVGDLGIREIAQIRRLSITGIRRVGSDVAIDAVPEAKATAIEQRDRLDKPVVRQRPAETGDEGGDARVR